MSNAMPSTDKKIKACEMAIEKFIEAGKLHGAQELFERLPSGETKQVLKKKLYTCYLDNADFGSIKELYKNRLEEIPQKDLSTLFKIMIKESNTSHDNYKDMSLIIKLLENKKAKRKFIKALLDRIDFDIVITPLACRHDKIMKLLVEIFNSSEKFFQEIFIEFLAEKSSHYKIENLKYIIDNVAADQMLKLLFDKILLRRSLFDNDIKNALPLAKKLGREITTEEYTSLIENCNETDPEVVTNLCEYIDSASFKLAILIKALSANIESNKSDAAFVIAQKIVEIKEEKKES